MSDLRKAAEAVLDRWDGPEWEWREQGPTAELMATLRTALADELTVKDSLTAEETLRRKNERLRAALKKYGRHLDDCELTLGGYQCTCGFNQQEQPEQKPVEAIRFPDSYTDPILIYGYPQTRWDEP